MATRSTIRHVAAKARRTLREAGLKKFARPPFLELVVPDDVSVPVLAGNPTEADMDAGPPCYSVQDVLSVTMKTLTDPDTMYKGHKVTGGNVQTLASSFYGSYVYLEGSMTTREQFALEVPGGGTLILVVCSKAPLSEAKANHESVIIGSHGVMGGADSAYLDETLKLLYEKGWIILKFVQRGSGGAPLTSPVLYHAGLVNDYAAVVNFAANMFEGHPLNAFGASLSGIGWGNYVGHVGDDSPLTSLFTLSAVFKLDVSAKTLEAPRKFPFNWFIGNGHNEMLQKNKAVLRFEDDAGVTSPDTTLVGPQQLPLFAFETISPPSTPNGSTPSLSSFGSDSSASSWASEVEAALLQAGSAPSTPATSTRSSISDIPQSIKTLEPFDLQTLNRGADGRAPHRYPKITDEFKAKIRAATKDIGKKTIPITAMSSSIIAPLAGFDSSEEFMAEISSAGALKGNTTPYLALNAADDPLLYGKDLPRDEVRASSTTILAITREGGHLGWLGHRKNRSKDSRWTARVAYDWFTGIEKLNLAPRPVPQFVYTDDNWVHPVGKPHMAYRIRQTN